MKAMSKMNWHKSRWILLAVSALLVLWGCTGSTIRLNVAALQNARVLIYNEGREANCEWNSLSAESQKRLQEWLPSILEETSLSFNTYAPDVVVWTQEYNVNIRPDVLICNLMVAPKRWRQYVRRSTQADMHVRQLLLMERSSKRP